MQWCVPFRRQHACTTVVVAARPIGATRLQPIADNTKLANNRRIAEADVSTSQPYVTMALSSCWRQIAISDNVVPVKYFPVCRCVLAMRFAE
jgi:hypothetical protein